MLINDWPFVFGKFIVGNKKASVAVATTGLPQNVEVNKKKVAIVGRLSTEDVGIEKLIENVITNRFIRFVIITGRRNLATQALCALQQHGVDRGKKIINATSKKARLTNIPKKFITRFQDQVTVVDATGMSLTRAINRCVRSNPRPYRGSKIKLKVPRVIDATRNKKFIIDPKGYFLVRVDNHRKKIVVEHIKDGKTTIIILGDTNESVRDTAARLKLIGHFEQSVEHAMYLGREVYKAELALKLGLSYEQDEPLRR